MTVNDATHAAALTRAAGAADGTITSDVASKQERKAICSSPNGLLELIEYGYQRVAVRGTASHPTAMRQRQYSLSMLTLKGKYCGALTDANRTNARNPGWIFAIKSAGVVTTWVQQQRDPPVEATTTATVRGSDKPAVAAAAAATSSDVKDAAVAATSSESVSPAKQPRLPARRERDESAVDDQNKDVDAPLA